MEQQPRDRGPIAPRETRAGTRPINGGLAIILPPSERQLSNSPIEVAPRATVTPVKAASQGGEIKIDANSGDNLLEVTANIEKPKIKMPLVIAGPWTQGARWNAAKGEVKLAYQRYFTDAMKARNWTPWDDLPLKEMQAWGHLLSDDTVALTQAYLGVEDYVGDYVLDGLNLIGKERERRDGHLAWGMEETKHANAWESVLLHSGRKTAKEIRDYRDRVAEHTWRMREDHPGLDTPMGVIGYAMVQERATYFNYDEIRKRIRSEYGLPEKVTQAERKRGMEIGAAGAFKTVANDEIAHHGFFLDLTRIYTHYLPDQMLGELVKVFKGFHMPSLNLIPDSVDLEAVMRRTRIHTPRTQVEKVNNPILNALGFDNRKALEKAAQEAKILPPGLGPQYVGISRSGEFVLSTTPDVRVQQQIPSAGTVFQADRK